MNHDSSKYFCLLKGDWQKRFFELIEMFQISLHKKFAIGVPENLSDQFNRVIVYGSSSTEDTERNNGSLSDDQIIDTFYKDRPAQHSSSLNSASDFEKAFVNFFEDRISYN